MVASSPRPPSASLIVRSLPKPQGTAHNSWNANLASSRAEVQICRRFCILGAADVLLAMQKVVGSNPSAALEKTCICRSFSLRQSPCSSASGRTDSGLAVRRLSAASRKNARFAGRFSFVRTEVILQACRRSGVPPAAGVGWLFLQTARSCARTPADAPPVIPILGGESDFSPDTLEVDLGPHSSASPGPPPRALR